MRGKAAALTALLMTLAGPAAAHGATLTFGAEADARVDEAAPGTNFGASYLRANGGSEPDVESFLRFNVSGVSGTVQSARLRLWVTNATTNGPAVFATSGSFTESSVTWTTRPGRVGAAVDDKGAVPASNWVEFDVTPLVSGNGTHTLALGTTSTDGVDFSSREAANTSQRPQLVIETASTGAPVNSSAPSISGTAQAGRVLTTSTGTWTGAEPISYAYQWRRCDAAGGSCANIAGATSGTYALGAADVGSTVRVVVTASNSQGHSAATSAPTAVVQPASTGDPVIAAAGDIASCAWSGDEATATVIDGINPTRVLALGDNVYENGTDAEFTNCYAPSWGRHKAITAPVPGNHEYQTPGATGYYNYFGSLAGDPAKGYYAFNLGSWRLYALNSNCSVVACSAGSAQEQWLRADLLANPASCKLAYWHHPRFSSAATSSLRSTGSVGPLYQAFYDASGDVLLQGHAHFYERLARLNPSGAVDATNGVRNFVVGTGGAALHGLGTPRAGSEVRNASTHGVLRLTMRQGSYSWAFTPIAGQTFTDSGSDNCGGTSQDSTAPSAPGNLTATAPSGTRVDLSWNASSDNVGVTGYDVYRGGTLVASVPGTSYTDTTVSAGTSYSYTVRARDAAGNLSQPSNTATVTTPGDTGGTTMTFAPEADARVDEAFPNTNFGTSFLRTNGGSQPDVESFLRFTVSGVSGPVRSARLRLWATNGTVDGPAAFATAATSWTETAVTWANRPSRTGSGLDDKGAIAAGTYVEWDVTPLVSGNGTLTIGLAGTSTDGVDFSAKETTNTARRPQLAVSAG
jgi:acid phosphatase type 7